MLRWRFSAVGSVEGVWLGERRDDDDEETGGTGGVVELSEGREESDGGMVKGGGWKSWKKDSSGAETAGMGGLVQDRTRVSWKG